MRIKTFSLAMAGTVLALSGTAQAQTRVHHVHRARIIVTTPPATMDPTWPVDYYIVPRYRYRPQDDRVDPYGPPVAPSYPEPGGMGIGQ
jgi:hypothetical protein